MNIRTHTQGIFLRYGGFLRRAAALLLALALMLPGTLSSFNVYSEDGSDEQPVAEAPKAEEKKEEPKPAPEPVKEEKKEEPKPAPEPAKPAAAQESPSEEPHHSSGEAAQSDTADSTEASEPSEASAETGSDAGINNELISDEDAAKENEEKKDFPAQSFSGSTSELRVKADAPKGVFPEGTTMKVKAVSAQSLIDAADMGSDTEVVSAAAADITFHKDGKEIQPEGALTVKLTSVRTLKGDHYKAVTMNDSGAVETVGAASAVSSEFRTDHFTVYGIIGGNYTDEDTEEYVRHTYEFYVGDYENPIVNTVKVDETIVHDGDTLTVPADPAGDAKHTFAGWFEADEEGNLMDKAVRSKTVSIDPATKSAAEKAGKNAEDKTIKVYAKYDEQYTVTIYTNEDKKVVFETFTGKDTDTIALTSPAKAMDAGFSVSAGETLTGWRNADGEGSQVTNDNTVRIDGADIELVPVFAAVHMVHFNKVKTLFDDYQVPDQRVLDDETVTEPVVFEKDGVYRGYRFDGWYVDNQDENPDAEAFDFTKGLTSDDPQEFTLYAKWTPQEVQIRAEIYLENANDSGYTLHETDESFKAEADGVIPLDEILKKYHDNKYRTPRKPGYLHLNGTKSYEQNPDATEQLLSDNRPAVEISDSKGEVASYSVADVNGGSYDAAANPDGTTVVRINYSRDTYNLKFAFYNWGAIITDANGMQTLNESGKKLAPEGYENTMLPTLRIKYGQHLYKRTHHYADSDAAVFDAFLKTQPWYFEKQGMDTGGQTVFDESNQNYPVRPASDIGDGGELGIRAYIHGNQKNYPIETRFYKEAWSVQDVIKGKAGDYTSETRTIVYLTDHPHEFTIGSGGDGYRLVQITNYGSVQLNKSGSYQYNNGKAIADGIHRFKWINGDNRNRECEPIILHYMPVSYSITFKQTQNGTVNGGRRVDADSKADDIVLGPYFYDQEIDIAALMAEHDYFASAGWQTLQDNNGVVYSPKDGWRGDVSEEGGFPVRMPAKNLVFYKEWDCDSYTVTFDWNRDGLPDGTEKVFTEENIAYGDAVKNPANADKAAASREGYVLLGWKAFERKKDGSRGNQLGDAFYSFNTPVKKNLYIEAQWAPVNGYRVNYLAGDHGKIGADSEIKDPRKYDSKAQAPVKYTASPGEGWVFIGWAAGGVMREGAKLYGSGDVISYSEESDRADGEADSVITLIAQYEKIDRTTSVTYHSNYPAGGPDMKAELNNLIINGSFLIALPVAADIGFMAPYNAPDGNSYRFIGWTTEADNHKVYADLASAREELDVFAPGETAAAGEKDNHLYAIWQVIVGKTLTVDPDKPGDEPGIEPGFEPESEVLGDYEDDTEKAVKKTSVKSAFVQTGDETEMMIYVALMAAALAGVILIIRRRKSDTDGIR